MAQTNNSQRVAILGFGVIALGVLVAVMGALGVFRTASKSGIEPRPDGYHVPELATVVGRLVDSNGKGIRARVRLNRLHAPIHSKYSGEPRSWQEQDRSAYSITESDGSFELRLRPWRQDRYVVETYAVGPDNGYPDLHANFGLEAGTRLDLGTVVVEEASLRGVLVDAENRRIRSGQQYFRRRQVRFLRIPPIANRDRLHPAPSFSVDIGADGTFQRSRVATGTYSLRPSHVHFASEEVTLVAGPNSIRLQGLRAAEIPTISGVVKDGHGQGVPDCWVVVEGLTGSARTRTERDGRFLIRAPGGMPTNVPVALVVVSGRGRRVPWRTPVPWQTKGLQLTLESGDNLNVVVVRATDGTPVDCCSLALWANAAGRLDARTWNSDDSPSPGQYWLEDLAPGPWRVHVAPEPHLRLASTDVDVAADLGTDVLLVRLQELRRQECIVRRADQTPVANAKIEWSDRRLPDRPRGHQPSSVRVGRTARTDDLGRAVLHVPANTPLTLRCSGPVPSTTLAIDQPSSRPVEITVPAGATVNLQRHAAAKSSAEGAFLVGMTAIGEAMRIPAGSESTIEFDASGAARFVGVPEGTWMVGVLDRKGQTTVVRTGLELAAGDSVSVRVE